jgi:hypothetical protein
VELIPPAPVATPPLDLSTPRTSAALPQPPEFVEPLPPALEIPEPPPAVAAEPPLPTEVPPLAAFMTPPPPRASIPPPALEMPSPPTVAEPPPLGLSPSPTPSVPPARFFPSVPVAPAPGPVASDEVFEVGLPEPVSVKTGRVMLPTAIGTPDEEMPVAGTEAEEPPMIVLPMEEVPSFDAFAEETPAPEGVGGKLPPVKAFQQVVLPTPREAKPAPPVVRTPLVEEAALRDPFGEVAPAGGGASGDVFQLEPPAPATAVPELVFAAEAPPPLELSPEARGALVQRVVPRALAQVGEVRELELEVPVPAVWTGGKRLTLQLRLTLIPEEETNAE